MIQNELFDERADRDLFARAHETGAKYLHAASNRSVFPTKKALEDLSVFEEALPDGPTGPDFRALGDHRGGCLPIGPLLRAGKGALLTKWWAVCT